MLLVIPTCLVGRETIKLHQSPRSKCTQWANFLPVLEEPSTFAHVICREFLCSPCTLMSVSLPDYPVAGIYILNCN